MLLKRRRLSAPAIGEVAPFNPNEAHRSTLEALALPANTIRSWLSYTTKGGRWHSLDDLRRFRALQAEDLERIRPYLVFPGAEGSDASGQLPDPSNTVLWPFDPNQATAQELESMGIPREGLPTPGNVFVAGGGRFRQAEDIRMVYGLPDELADRLIPYVVIAEDEEEDESSANEPSVSSTESRTIDINQASQQEWQALRGIGPKLSSRIIRFRDKLGGFHRIEQVAETYGLPDSTFQSIRTQLQLSPIFRPLPINSADVKELAGHPYLTNREAEALVNYRNNHGPFQSAADLESVLALKAETKVKIGPYLEFE